MEFNAKSIIGRLKKALNLKTDEDLSAFLGIARTTVSSWKQRNTLDIQLIVEKCGLLDYNHILVNNANCVDSKQEKSNPSAIEVNKIALNYNIIEIIEPYLIKIGKLERTIELLKEQIRGERINNSDVLIEESLKSSERERRLKKSALDISAAAGRG